MREQTIRVKTGKIKKIFLFATVLMMMCVVAAGIYRMYNPPYSPPAFEETAVIGTPEPPANMEYGEISAQGGFSFAISGAMYQQEDGSLILYLTNPSANDINLMCEIKDTDGNQIYKSGVLRPGEYVEKLKPLKKLPNEALKIQVNIYAFEIDTWYSKGTISLSNTLQPY